MKSITLRISEQDLQRLNLSANTLTFAELVQKITAALAREALIACQTMAKQEGLDQISWEEINAEIKAVRDC